jgi:Fe-S-cluster-containing hydrogenase component 2
MTFIGHFEHRLIMRMSIPKRILTFNPRFCDGCGDCVEACIKRLGVSGSTPALKLVKGEGGSASLSFCLQCDRPLCKVICPTGSVLFDEATGLSWIRNETCIGCRSCFLICPIEGVMFDALTGKAVKCDLCGGDPHCVKVCDKGALKYTFAEDLSKTKEDLVALSISASTKAGLLVMKLGLELSKKTVGDTLLFSQIVSAKAEGLRRFLEHCANNLSTIFNEAALTTFSETVLRRRRGLGLSEIKRPKEEVQTLLKNLSSLSEESG